MESKIIHGTEDEIIYLIKRIDPEEFDFYHKDEDGWEERYIRSGDYNCILIKLSGKKVCFANRGSYEWDLTFKNNKTEIEELFEIRKTLKYFKEKIKI